MTDQFYNEVDQDRFGGIARLYGQQAQALFSRVHVCVIGIGGVGSWAAEALARTGIGTITLVDMDDVCITNTNRQNHALRQNIGQVKTAVMEQRILAINPKCQVHCIYNFVTPDNVVDILDRNFSYVIDAIDSVRPKAALLAHCRRYKIPVVTTGGAGGQIDPTRIMVVDLAKTIRDPLAAKLRERLKYNFNIVKNSKGKLRIDCVSSSEPLMYPQIDGSVCPSRPSATGTKRMDCTTGLGASTMVTATFGFIAVAHVLKKMIAKSMREAEAK
ncbi:tRNA cyclic N6-threonylcarbamoyladenosine(37) synthase TcdA [Candidatus Fukatsuia endosymbiont of Tuberolachnus salignus]|uniref:tRNA cyclic N6-threonylcarbamoyladenosine(37) synthase TcdA n=1 Tax=Candidatus Fukatsuia endosymbiont of Tuberolachnus salignus TaxID=3077957 RepID=UPI00313E0164